MDYFSTRHMKLLKEKSDRNTSIWITAFMVGGAFSFGYPESAYIIMFVSLTYTLYDICDQIKDSK